MPDNFESPGNPFRRDVDAPKPDPLYGWWAGKIVGAGLLMAACAWVLLTSEEEIWSLRSQMGSTLAHLLIPDSPLPEAGSAAFFAVLAGFVYTAFSTAFAFEFLGWFHERYRHLDHLGGKRKYEARWAVFAFFVPFVNLVLPLRIARDLWQQSQPEAERDPFGPPDDGIVDRAWVAWLTAYGLLALAIVITLSAPQQAAGLLGWAFVGFLGLEIFACLWVAKVTREIERRQGAWAPAMGTAAPFSLERFGPRHGLRVFIGAGILAELIGILALLDGIRRAPTLVLLITQVTFLAAALAVLHLGAGGERSRIGGRPTRFRLGEIGGLLVGLGTGLLWIPLIDLLVTAYEQSPTVYDAIRQQIGLPGLLITAVLMAPLIEEFAFRGVMLQAFRTRLGPVAAVLLSALLFALIHGYLFQRATTFLLGCLCGLARIATGSLWPAVILHAVNNLVAMTWPHLLPQPSPLLMLLGLGLIGAGLGIFHHLAKSPEGPAPPAARKASLPPPPPLPAQALPARSLPAPPSTAGGSG